MKLTKEMEEKLIMIIQAVIGIVIIGLSIKNSAKQQTGEMKKVLAKNAKQIGRMNKMEYKFQKKMMKQKYQKQLKKK